MNPVDDVELDIRSQLRAVLHDTIFPPPTTSRGAPGRRLNAITSLLDRLMDGVIIDTELVVHEGMSSRFAGVMNGCRQRVEVRREEMRIALREKGVASVDVVGVGDVDLLVEVVKTFKGEVEVVRREYEDLVMGRIYIPTIAAKSMLEHLVPLLVGFSKNYQSTGPDLEEVVRLYEEVKSLEKLCILEVDYVLGDFFKIREWFRPFIKDWLHLSEVKIAEWTRSMIELDDLSQIVALGTSSSVIDMMTAFQQQLKFFVNLNWPDPDEADAFMDRLLQNFGDGLERYTIIMRDSFKTDSVNPVNPLPVPETASIASSPTATSSSPSLLSSTKKRAFTFKKIKLPGVRKPTSLNPSEIRIPLQSCVRLNNLHLLPESFEGVLQTVMTYLEKTERARRENGETMEAGAFRPRLPPRREERRSCWIDIEAFGWRVVRPFTRKVEVRVLAEGKREVMRTRRYGLGERIKETVGVVLTGGDMESVSVSIVHHVPCGGGSDEIAVASVGVRDGEEVNVAGGHLKVGIVEAETVKVLRARCRWICEKGEDAGIEEMASRMFYDLRNNLKELSKGYKKGEMLKTRMVAGLAKGAKVFKFASASLSHSKSSSSLKEDGVGSGLSGDEVHVEISPLLEQLDANLGIINETLTEDLTRTVVIALWKRIVDVCTSLIVPALMEENFATSDAGGAARGIGGRAVLAEVGLVGDKKPAWDEMRVVFLRWTVEIFKSILHSDGDGIPLDLLEDRDYRSLQKIFEHYDIVKKEILIAEHQKWLYSQRGEEDDEWLLRLIRLRGGKDYVEPLLQQRAQAGT
ncbi:hypothetical protein HK101_004259 [Irineochytrium annulatum]|nr:hypothetical protein HK101_004259 [Irineochytrium annulatum]